MADSDNTLKIQIDLQKTGDGATVAQTELDKLKASTRKGTDEQNKATEATNEHNKKLEGSRLLFGELNRIVPGLGHILHAAFAGPVGPAIALALGISEIKRSLDDYNKAMDATAAENAEASFAEGIEAVKAAVTEARSKLEQYADEVERVAAAEQSIAVALAEQLELMRAIATARADAAKAAQAAQAADTHRRQAAGEISPEQAILAETAQAITAAKAAAADKKKVREDEEAAKQVALEKAAAAQPGLDENERLATERYYADKAHRDRLQKDFGGEPETQARAKAQAERDKTQAELDADPAYQQFLAAQKAYADNPLAQNKANLEGARASLGAYDVFGGPNNQEKIDRVAQLDAELHNRNRGEAQLREVTSPQSNDAFDREQSAAGEAARKGKENAEEVARLRRELAAAHQQDAGVQQSEDQALASRIAEILSDAVTKLYKEPRGAEVEAGVKTAGKVEGNKPVTSAEAQFLLSLDQSLGGHAGTLKEAADHVSGFRDNTAAFLDAVIALTKNGFTAQQRQLDGLAAIVERLQSQQSNGTSPR